MRSFADYEREYENLTAGQAIDLLIELDAITDRIIVEGAAGNIMMTPMRMCFKIPGERKASTLGPIQFCGGPPGTYTWVVGSLLAMVMDKVMYRDAKEEAKARRYGMKVAVKA